MEQTQISSWLSDFETKLSYATNDSEHNIAYTDAIPIGADLASCMADYYIRNGSAYSASCIPAEIALDATRKYAVTASDITSAIRRMELGRRRQLSFEMTPYDNDTYIEELHITLHAAIQTKDTFHIRREGKSKSLECAKARTLQIQSQRRLTSSLLDWTLQRSA